MPPHPHTGEGLRRPSPDPTPSALRRYARSLLQPLHRPSLCVFMPCSTLTHFAVTHFTVTHFAASVSPSRAHVGPMLVPCGLNFGPVLVAIILYYPPHQCR